MTFTIRCTSKALREISETLALIEAHRESPAFVKYGNTTLLCHQFKHMLCFEPPLLTEQVGSQNGMTDTEFTLSSHSSGISRTDSGTYDI